MNPIPNAGQLPGSLANVVSRRIVKSLSPMPLSTPPLSGSTNPSGGVNLGPALEFGRAVAMPQNVRRVFDNLPGPARRSEPFKPKPSPDELKRSLEEGKRAWIRVLRLISHKFIFTNARTNCIFAVATGTCFVLILLLWFIRPRNRGRSSCKNSS
jgi:hypothetical protein